MNKKWCIKTSQYHGYLSRKPLCDIRWTPEWSVLARRMRWRSKINSSLPTEPWVNRGDLSQHDVRRQRPVRSSMSPCAAAEEACGHEKSCAVSIRAELSHPNEERHIRDETYVGEKRERCNVAQLRGKRTMGLMNSIKVIVKMIKEIMIIRYVCICRVYLFLQYGLLAQHGQ